MDKVENSSDKTTAQFEASKNKKFAKYDEFGSCSKCGQCNMTTAQFVDVTLYKETSSGKFFCHGCCGTLKG